METLHKRADKYSNKIIIPVDFIRKYGRYFIMELYEDKIIIKPDVKKE